MVPLMYWLQGNYRELPQATHKWNYLPINLGDHFWIEGISKVVIKGDPKACPKYWRKLVPVFHMPRFGGWNQFVVLRPKLSDWNQGDVWYVGWKCGRDCGVSMIPLHGEVRLLIGRKDVEFFALDKHHVPIGILLMGRGQVGKAGNFGKAPMR